MELFFLALLVILMASALASGFPVAFSLPGSAILTIGTAALAGAIFAGDTSAYFAQGSPMNWLSAGVTNFRGIYWEVERDTLIAIPLFIFMGIMLQRSKIAEDLLVSMAQLFGPVRGGLGISVVFVGALLAATTGIVGATVVAMGLISLPAMLRNKYSHPLATGTIAASGTLGQIIPPSIVLIILADQLSSAVDQASAGRKALFKETTGQFSLPSEFGVSSTSAGDMFMGALAPGLILVGLYMLYILFVAYIRPNIAPAVPFSGKYDRKFAVRVLLSLVPPLTLIFVVLGSIITGVATVNQAGAIGAVGATIMAGYRLREGKKGAYTPAITAILSLIAILVLTSTFSINIKNIRTTSDAIVIALASVAVFVFLVSVIWSGWRALKIENTLRGVMIETAKTSSLVFIILLGAAMLTASFRAFGGESLVRDFLTGLPGGFWAQFIIVMAVIFVLGFFLDFIEISVVVVPIVAPILLMDPSANVTAVWLGVMIGLNIQTSFLTPPFGFALFYLRGVAPAAVRTIQMYKGVVPFIALQLVALAIVASFPALVNYIPTRVALTGATAPPPKNPRLQACMEEYIFARYKETGGKIRTLIAEARQWDISYLPPKLRKSVAGSFDKAEVTFVRLDEAFAASAIIDAAKVDYMPIHRKVRSIQSQVRRIDKQVMDLQDAFGRLGRQGNGGGVESVRITGRIAILKAERKKLESAMPTNWKSVHAQFVTLLKAEKKARLLYRRTSDGAYEPIIALYNTIMDVSDLAGLEDRMKGLAPLIETAPLDVAVQAISDTSKALGKIANTSTIRSALSKARRALKAKKFSREKALAVFTKGLEIFESEVAWRTRAKRELTDKVTAYEAAIRDTMGLRLQKRLPGYIAREVAACSSGHNDISPYF